MNEEVLSCSNLGTSFSSRCFVTWASFFVLPCKRPPPKEKLHCRTNTPSTQIVLWNEPYLSLAGTMTWQAYLKAVKMSACWFTKTGSCWMNLLRRQQQQQRCLQVPVCGKAWCASEICAHRHKGFLRDSCLSFLSWTPNWSPSNGQRSLQLFIPHEISWV